MLATCEKSRNPIMYSNFVESIKMMKITNKMRNKRIKIKTEII